MQVAAGDDAAATPPPADAPKPAAADAPKPAADMKVNPMNTALACATCAQASL